MKIAGMLRVRAMKYDTFPTDAICSVVDLCPHIRAELARSSALHALSLIGHACRGITTLYKIG